MGEEFFTGAGIASACAANGTESVPVHANIIWQIATRIR